MRQVEVLYKDMPAGVLIQNDDGSFSFKYYDAWLTDTNKPNIGMSLPKLQKEFKADFLFPLFYNMLPEGSNKNMICNTLRIDADDYFGLLIHTASIDTIGSIKVKKNEIE